MNDNRPPVVREVIERQLRALIDFCRELKEKKEAGRAQGAGKRH